MIFLMHPSFFAATASWDWVSGMWTETILFLESPHYDLLMDVRLLVIEFLWPGCIYKCGPDMV
jgi:hypothetical protein